MKIFTSAILATVLLFSLGSLADASIVIFVSDDGADTTYSMTGTMDLTSITAQHTFAIDFDLGTSNQLYSADGTVHRRLFIGTLSMGVPGAGFSQTSNGVGTSFGFTDHGIIWDDSFTSNPGVVNVNRTWTIAGRTIASQFGTLLDSGPVVLWTLDATGETISITNSLTAAVPEPSSFAMFAACLVGFSRRRRR